jgi:peroxiredoxin
MNATYINKDVLDAMSTNKGVTLAEYSFQKPTLLIFLRNFGCTFCRQAMKDIASLEEDIRQRDINLVFVHLSDEETAQKYFSKYKLQQYPRISDPGAKFYKVFGLMKGTFKQLLGLQVFLKGMQSVVWEGNGVNMPIGDGFQMPGIFLIQGEEIKVQYIHKYASDRPNYLNLIDCCTSNSSISK